MQLIKRFLGRSGIYAARKHKLSAGIDLALDLDRLGISPRTIFDIGANCGQSALKYADAWPSAVIHSFEPFPSTFELLNQAVRDLSQVHTHNVAMGSEVKSVRANGEPGAPSNSIENSGEDPSATLIQVTTVDRFCDENNISQIGLLKSDTEGYELEVIAGARRMFTERRVLAFLVEVDFDRTVKQHCHFFDVFTAIEQYGYRFVSLYEGRLNSNGWDFGNALFISPTRNEPSNP